MIEALKRWLRGEPRPEPEPRTGTGPMQTEWERERIDAWEHHQRREQETVRALNAALHLHQAARTQRQMEALARAGVLGAQTDLWTRRESQSAPREGG